jgi:hypothetical protein
MPVGGYRVTGSSAAFKRLAGFVAWRRTQVEKTVGCL